MRTCFTVGLVALLTIAGTASGQSIDLGRGELPLRVPAGYSSDTPIPLVVLLHGYGYTGARQDAYLKFGELVDGHGFLLVHPDGTQQESGRNPRFWNASKACCDFGGSTVDDSAYVLSIINTIKSEYSIDAKRVYLIGHSNGGFMSYRAALDHSDTIAAIASLAGAASSDDRPAPPHPVHVLQIHGTDDSTIAYEGDEIQGTSYPGAVETVERWAAYNGCAVEGMVQDQKIDLEGEITGLETTVTRYAKGCTAGGSSELWTIAGGSHVPSVSDSFGTHVIEWLLAHPKP